jgi:phospholipase C
MADSVMTMGRIEVTVLLRGTANAPLRGDFREIPFMCRFSADAVNSGRDPVPRPQIMVTVSTEVPEYQLPLEIIPPGGHAEVLARERSAGRPVSWARRVVMDAGRPQVESRSAARRAMGGWEVDDPFGEIGDLPLAVYMAIPGLGGGARTGGGGARAVGGIARTYVHVLDPAVDEPGTWTVRVRNIDQDDHQLAITIDYPETVQVLHETRIPFQLVNRAFAQALLSMQLRMRIDSGEALIQFDETFKKLTGIEDQAISVSDLLQDINLQGFTVKMCNDGGHPTIVVGLDLEDRGDEISYHGLDINVDNLAITCRVQLWFSYPISPFFETAMRRENGQVVLRQRIDAYAYLDANPNINGFWASFANAILTATGLVGITQGSSIDDYVQPALDAAEDSLTYTLSNAAPYFQDVIMHLVNRDDILFRLTADDDAIVVLHHRRPSPLDFLGVSQPAGGAGAGDEVTAVRESPVAPVSPEAPVAAMVAGRASSGPVPDGRLHEGEIDHIVVLMMENRSFDHMLGYRHFAHPEVNGLAGNESNPLPHGAPYDVHHLAVTSGLISPEHGFEATLEQVADGSMSGFVQSYSKRPGVVDPGVVMGYYDGTDLPMYEFLANNFATCDAWHSAFPGETQCNRFTALTGATPELTNLALSDRRVAYYNGFTIFDYLSQAGIDWAYAEGNIAFLRMFDKYRIDTSHVIPYDDRFKLGIEDTFVRRVCEGRLPSVSFIDPRFIDVPPEWDANDDLPPADVCRGQQLIRDVYKLLSGTPATWPKTLFLLTYDEHGGFFDHEAPPGMPTPHHPHPAPFPPVHPDGPHHLGVRVPAFVVSPWVDGGTVFHTTYDHTSILKTILQRFAPQDFPVGDFFGPRAAAANGLLSEPLRARPRRQDPPRAPSVPCQEPSGPTGPPAELDDDFHTSMWLLGLPAKYRDRAAGP